MGLGGVGRNSDLPAVDETIAGTEIPGAVPQVRSGGDPAKGLRHDELPWNSRNRDKPGLDSGRRMGGVGVQKAKDQESRGAEPQRSHAPRMLRWRWEDHAPMVGWVTLLRTGQS